VQRGGPPGGEVDLHTLLGQFTALRHEVNLQTRAVRGQQEQNAETLKQLVQALQLLQQQQQEAARQDEAARDEQVRSLLKKFVELYDALAPAEREVQRVCDVVLPELDQLVGPSQPAAPPPRRSFWARLFSGRPAPPADGSSPENGRRVQAAVERIRQVLGSLRTGYTMSLQRLERALAEQGLEPIRSAGQPFDPEQMEAIEVVADAGRPGGEVIDEVRRGYRWRGRVFRYAQVRVARAPN
jgi:molecular chaperone GrpE